MSSSTCGTGSQRRRGNFTRQPFTVLCRSGTTARANTSDMQVLVSVPNAPYILNCYTDIFENKTDKGHIPSPWLEIKIAEFAGYRTQAAGFEVLDFTDQATETDLKHCKWDILYQHFI